MHTLASTLCLLLALAIAPIQSLPSGAPICNALVDRIKGAHGSDSAQIGYGLDVQKKGDAFEIKVKNSGAQSDFKGLLMYVVGKDENVHLGSFKNMDSSNFKFVTSGCQGGAESTVTHSNGNSKPFTSAFTWSPSPGDETKGPFKIVSIVTAGRTPWQKLDDVPLELGASAPSTTGAGPAPPTPGASVLPPMGMPAIPPSGSATGAPPRKFKCRLIKPAQVQPAQMNPTQLMPAQTKPVHPQSQQYAKVPKQETKYASKPAHQGGTAYSSHAMPPSGGTPYSSNDRPSL